MRAALVLGPLVGVALTSGPAFSLSADAFLAALNRPGLPSATVTIRYVAEAALVEGDDTIVLKNAEMVSLRGGEVADDIPIIPLGTVRFEGVRAEGADGYRYDVAVAEAYSGTYESEDQAGVFVDWSVGGYRLIDGYIAPSNADTATLRLMPMGGFYRRGELGTIKYGARGPRSETLLSHTFGGFTSTYDWEADPVVATLKMSEFVLDLTAGEETDPEFADFLDKLPYDRIVVDAGTDWKIARDWTSATIGFDLRMDGAGSLNLQFELAGGSVERAFEINESYVRLEVAEDGEYDDALARLIAAVDPLELRLAKLRWVDDGFTDMALEWAAGETQASRPQLVGALTAGIPIGLGAIGAGDLIAPAYEAASTYLFNPGSLSIAAKPSEILTIGDVRESVWQDPRSITPRLGLSIEGSAGG